MSQDALLLVVGAAALAFVALKLFAARPKMPAQAAAQAVNAGTAVLIDVREPAEWTGGVAQPAHLLPLSDLRGARTRWRPFLEANRGKQLLVYCHSGGRSAYAASILRKEGFEAVNLGGFSTWVRAGLPTRRAR